LKVSHVAKMLALPPKVALDWEKKWAFFMDYLWCGWCCFGIYCEYSLTQATQVFQRCRYDKETQGWLSRLHMRWTTAA
jgi:hypothetical protein